MRGYTTNYVNLISDNLRDRYQSGFPILKELIQNADDAKARSFIFGTHPGFPDSPHPLLKGSGLWIFNDGGFKKSDADGLRSFGIGAKAGDASAIGKFGLGMKSVFHLCEALFYVAWDGQDFHCEGLTPWKQDGHTLHQEWDETDDSDWDRLRALGRKLAADSDEDCTWFLLWLPLRTKAHLLTHSSQETGAIISRFPGDDPAGELAFLDDEKLAYDVAEIIPLLRHLERVEHKGENNRFVMQLGGTARLLGDPPLSQVGGEVRLSNGYPPLPPLAFSGLRAESSDTWFADMKARAEWPRARYRDEWGHECQALDKTSPEAAVTFCSSRGNKTRSRLHWAVFLPVEDNSEDLGADRGERAYSLVLHGQFFLDAGRKKIHDLEHLHADPVHLDGAPIDEGLLRRAWNQRLAQDVLLPLVLPALEGHAKQQKLSDNECDSLTESISKSDFFRRFRGHVCRDGTWLRTLQRGTDPRWRLVEGNGRSRLRPLPKAPNSAPDRPWKVFPNLNACNVVAYDVSAPWLSPSGRSGKWLEEELEILLSRVDGLFVDAPSMDYLIEFLESCAGPHKDSERIEHRLLVMMRTGLRNSELATRRQVAAKASRLVGFLDPRMRLEISSELPESILGRLWEMDAPLLLVPKGMDREPRGKACPGEEALVAWLEVLNGAFDSMDRDGAQEPILAAIRGLLGALPDEVRRDFLRAHPALRIIGVREVRSAADKPVSIEYLDRIRAAGTLFRFSEALGSASMEIARLLARAIPNADVCLVRAKTYRELNHAEGDRIPLASDGAACLAAVGRHTGRLGDIAERRAFLERANAPGTDDAIALRGMRFLLHGSPDHRTDDDARLWIGRHGQHSAWLHLWAVTHAGGQWSLIPEELADALPRNRWTQASIAEIDAQTLIDELRETCQDVEEPEAFSIEERNEILSRIEKEDLWRRLSLHTTVDGRPVSASECVYLASPDLDREDPLTCEATLIASSENAHVAEKQRKWLRPLDDVARIEIALRTPDPAHYWRSVMNALNRWPDEIPEDSGDLLRTTVWLPTTYGAPVKPEDVINLRGTLQDEAHRLVAEHRVSNGPCFAVPKELDPAVQGHEAWPLIRKTGFSSDSEGLDRLGLLLEDLPNYHIGNWRKQPAPDETELLARYDDLPGWRLLQMAAESFDLETAWTKLGPALSQEINVEKLVKVLGWITRDSDRWQLRKSVHDVYLRQLAMHGQSAADFLPHLRLASADGSWRKSAELCAGAHGVVRASLLDTRQESILGDLVCRAGAGREDDRVDASGVRDATFRQYRNTLLADLSDYFRSWDANLVPTPMIGVVLALLGPAVREFANKYLHPHSFEWLVSQLPWRDPGRTPWRLEWMGEKTADDALKLIEAGVEVHTGDEVEVLNLLGAQIEVPLDQDPKSLLAGPLNWQGGGYGVMIPLRRIDPGRFQQEQLGELLRATAERLYDHLYSQRGADFGVVWKELNQSDQLEIEIARRLILDHIPFYLRQLSVRCKSIEKRLAICDRLRRRIAEAEADGGQSAESARKEWRKSVDEFADRIDRNPVEQQAIVQAVKGKIEQYQYDPSSIPLELFQNADDAAVELGQFHPHPAEGCQVPPAARRFVVEEREDGLGFLHWGRLVNARGPVGFDGEGRGYDRDLEKMLILSATDKPGDEGLTGKFGLGFKSVLLACEQPRILSGRLAIRVVAGILPQPWKDAHEGRQRLNLRTDSGLPGTLIDLPEVDGEHRDRLLTRFRRLAGILCVFGRAIRTIAHVSAAAETVSRWQPSEIFPGVEIGELDLRGDWGVRTRALCVRTDSGSILMAIGPQGFRCLPECVPALWVTTPTRESSAFGFAVNGSFDVDAGRGRLAGHPDNNLKKAKRIGGQAGAALGALLELSRNDWGSVRSKFGLAADLDPLDFWESIWLGLTNGWLTRHRGDGEDLVREVALGALTRLCDWPRAVPNGLKGPLREFSDAGDIRYELRGTLLSDKVSEVLGAWERFTNRYPGKMCVSGEIANVLGEADLRTPQPVGLSALVGLLERSRVQPDDAGVLGRLYLLTEDTPDWESKDLSERLKVLLFRSEANAWVESRKLLACHGSDLDPDEPRRHALAPPECRLHSDYYAESANERPAVTFFMVCRQRMEAPADKIARWMLNAASVEARRTALGYLADGELGERVAEHVREQGWLRTALHDLHLTDGLTEEQRDRLRRRLIPRTHLERAVVQTDDGEYEPTYSHVELPIALERLYQWWANEGHERAGEYRNRVYPQDPRNLNLKSDPEIGGLDRPSWFMLLALGSFQSIGRTREEQHRGFVRRCQDKRWWKVFTDCDPAKEPEKWMNIIEEYAEAQHEDEEWTQWLAQFPKLYRLRRWLEEYIGLFLSMNRFDEPFTRDEILAPRVNRHFQGGGIDSPPLTRTLKVGFPFVVRELLHDGVIENSLAIPHAYAPIERVKSFFREFGCEISTSEDIHKILNEHLGSERATFTGNYDIPLRIISSDASLRKRLLR